MYQAAGDPAVAAERLGAIRAAAPDLVLALGTRAALLARDGCPDRPLVFTAVTDPVGSGLVPSWAGSQGRLAGNSNWLPAIELLRAFRAAAPHLRHLGVLADPENAVSRREVAELDAARQERFPDLVLHQETVHAAGEAGPAAERLVRAGVQALWLPIDPLVDQQAAAIATATDPAHVPIFTSAAGPIRDRAIVSVVPDYHVLGLQAADLARRVLVEHADPGALPVGRIGTFRTVVNLQAAARAGYEVPLPLLATADEVIR